MRRGANAAEESAPTMEPERFIRENLPRSAVPQVPEVSLHLAGPGSRLSRLADAGDGERSPYWAFVWGGGLALARHVLDHPDLVRGRTVLDIGSGSGLVAIASKLAGASEVTAAEIDPNGCAAIRLNAEANGVALTILPTDVLDTPAPLADLVTAGDVFYDETLARRMLPLLQALRDRGSLVLVGDPGRTHLPLTSLRTIAEYDLGDFASGGTSRVRSAVYELSAT